MTRSSLLLATVLLGACATDRTEVIVVTDTDLSVPTELDEMRVDVTGPGGETQQAVARFEPGDPAPPRSVGIVHDGPRLGPYTVHARGLLNGTTIVERVAEVTLQRGRTLVLRMDLLRSCIGESCAAGETCAAGGCRSAVIAPEELEEFSGRLPSSDGSIGGDAGSEVDAGPPVDAGMFDGCAPATETCNGEDDDCDSMIDETFDLTSDALNCGACGNACNLANATSECTASDCAIQACDTGFDDCDGNPANGCEADLSAPETCGDCGTQCGPPDRNCCSGTCC